MSKQAEHPVYPSEHGNDTMLEESGIWEDVRQSRATAEHQELNEEKLVAAQQPAAEPEEALKNVE